MFKIKAGLKDAAQVFGQNRAQLLAFAFGWTIIMAASFYFSYIYGFAIVAIIFVFLPLELSLVTITKKLYENLNVTNRDFYVGFRALMVSIAIHSKMMLKGFLWALLLSFILSVIGSAIVLIVVIPEILASGDYNAMLDAVLTNSQLVDGLTIVSILAFVVGGVVYNLKSYDGQIAPHILLDTGFDINMCKIISEKLTLKDRKLIIKSKLMFYAYYVVAILAGVLLGYFLMTNQILTSQYSSFTGFFVSALFIAPIHLLANLYYNSLYRSNYQDNVRQQLQEYVNVKMRINQQQFLKKDEDFENEKKKTDDEPKDDNR